MRLSDKKRSEAYSAISAPIIDLRIAMKKGYPSTEKMDLILFDLEITIWRRLHKALNLEGPA